jgi:hypothetical protein
VRINHHRASIAADGGYELYIFTDEATQHFVGIRQDIFEQNELRLDYLLPTERQQLPCK